MNLFHLRSRDKEYDVNYSTYDTSINTILIKGNVNHKFKISYFWINKYSMYLFDTNCNKKKKESFLTIIDYFYHSKKTSSQSNKMIV
jgi:hypothetical protein